MKGRQPAVRPGKSGSPIIPGLGADLPALQKARVLWQANRLDKSVELFERRHQVTEAFAQIEDCLRHDPSYAEAQLFRARRLRRLNRGDESLGAFQKMAHDN